MNLRSECIVPDDFTDFRACNTQSEVVSNTSKYSLGFGQKSEFDTATEDLYKDYGDKFANKEDSKSYFGMLTSYQSEM